MKVNGSYEIIEHMLFVDGGIFIDFQKYTTLQQEYLALLQEKSKALSQESQRTRSCKMVVMKGGKAV